MAVVTEIEGSAQTIPGSAFTSSIASPALAYPLAPTASIQGSLTGFGDQDTFVVQLLANQIVRLDIDGTASSFGTTVAVTDPMGGAFSVDGGPGGGADPGSVNASDPFTEYTAFVAGAWSFRVSASLFGTGAYTLHISIMNLPVTLTGTPAADTVTGAAGGDSLGGADGDDSIDGQDGADSLVGGNGQDTLAGGIGVDTLAGGIGNDVLDGFFGADLLAGDAGNDTLLGGEGDDRLDGGDGNDSLSGGIGADRLVGGAGNDSLEGDGPASLAGIEFTVFDDVLFGGAGDDVMAGSGGRDQVEGGTGNDTLRGDHLDGAETLGAWNDTLLGQAGNDSIEGGPGDDLANGGSGADTVLGGLGRDRLIGGDGNDMLHDNRIAAFAGADTVSDIMDGGRGADTLVGGFGDRLLGGEEGDLLTVEFWRPFEGGRFFVDGGSGTDTLRIRYDGSSFVNSYELTAAPDGTGTLTVLAQPEFGPAFRVGGAFNGIERIEARGTFTGSDLIRGGAGADSLYGSGGIGDVLAGGAGNDVITSEGLPSELDASGVAIDAVLLGEAGNDSLYLQGWYGSGFVDGGDGNDRIVAYSGFLYSSIPAGDIHLAGGAGADTVSFLAGIGFADGGSGDDVLVLTLTPRGGERQIGQYGGGEGRAVADTLILDFIGFERFDLTGSGAADRLEGAGGADTLRGGLFGADTLIGGDGNDVLDGASGADSLVGGAGSDLYIVDNTGDLVVDGGAGADTVQASVSFTLPNNVETLVLLGGAGLSGNGNASDNMIVGTTGNDTLVGNNGADTLNGGAGADRLTGGPGNDIFVLTAGEAAGDAITFFTGNGSAGAGDVLRLQGFGAGATLVGVLGIAGSYVVQGSGGSATFTLAGTLDLGAMGLGTGTDDVVFA